MNFRELEQLAQREVLEFLFNECDASFVEVVTSLQEDGELPEGVSLWAFFSEYDDAPRELLNFMEGMLSVLTSFGYKVIERA